MSVVDQGNVDVAGEVDRYGELTGIHIALNMEVFMNNSVGPDLPADGDSSGEMYDRPPLLGRLTRGEVAELVAVVHEYSYVLLSENDNTGTTPGSWAWDHEMFLGGDQVDTERASVQEEDWEWESDGSDFGNSLADGSTFSFGRFDTSSIHNVGMAGFAGFSDSVDSRGGGGQQGYVNREVFNYRREFGRGPFVDRNTDIQVGGYLRWDEIDLQSFVFKSVYHLYFDTFELAGATDRLELNELIG